MQRSWLLPLFIGLFSSTTLRSQDTLMIETAINIALEKNYGIIMVRNEAAIAELSNTAGNAGMLPVVYGQVTDNFSQSDIFQRFAAGNEISAKNAMGNNLSAAVRMDWTVFDGFRMFATREKLKSLDEQAQILLRQQIATTIEEVTGAYGAIVTAEQQLQYLDEIIAYNREREKIALARFEGGTAAKTDWLQAKIDLNNQLQQRMQLQTDVTFSRNTLGVLLALPEESSFSVRSFVDEEEVDIQNIGQSLSSGNYELLLANKNKRIAELTIKEAESVRLPTLTLSGAYNFTNVNNSAGFSLLNRSYGPAAGLVLTIPIYNGGVGNRIVQTARLQAESASLMVSAVEQRISAEFKTERENYLHLLEIKKLEEESAVFAKEFLAISTERFRQGQTTSLEISQAQVTYQNSVSRLTQTEYDLSMAKVRLLLMAGKF